MKLQLAMAAAAAWLLGSAASARAAPVCAAEAMNALHVAGLVVTEAKAVAATAQAPAHCQALGTVVTRGEGAPEGLARFSVQLPDAWKQRFLFLGVGGNAGNLIPSANGVDRAEALGKGYVVILTDTGHVGDGATAAWTRRPDGSFDQAKAVDFFYRAAHDVTVAGKALAQAYYAAPIVHAYFDGCSTGGRMALMEAERYPDDYAGIIAGDPSMDFNLQTMRMTAQKAALTTAQAYIPPATIARIDARVTALCDALDGAKDGLVQDPARCPVRAQDLLCRPGESQDCLNPAQVRLMRSYTTPLRDRRGRLVYPGWPITNLSDPVGMSDYTTGETPPNLADPAAPWGDDPKAAPRAWELARQTLSNWMGGGPMAADMTKLDIDTRANVVGDDLLAAMGGILSGGDAKDPARLRPFIARGGKLILYHGASDPSIPAARTILFYRQLSALLGGVGRTQANVRLFLAPGMHHCGGGVGPDRFDTLTPLEDWVEKGRAPAAIAASTRPDAAVQHRLPLCPYPRQARYLGHGDLADAANWKCAAVASRASAKAVRPASG